MDEMSKHVMDSYNYKSLMDKLQLKMSIQKSDISRERETSIRRVMLSYSQIGYQKLTLKAPTSKERNQRRNLASKNWETWY